MKQKTVPVACALTIDEYNRFKEIAEKNGMYPSEAVRFAVNLYMRIAAGERLDGDGIKELMERRESAD